MEKLEKIDFGKFQKEYEYLNDIDIGFLNNFINTNLDTFLSLKKNSEKYSYFSDIFLSIILGISFSVLLFIIFHAVGIKGMNELNIFLYLGMFSIILSIFLFILFSRSGKKNFSPKKTSDTIFFIKNFINNIDEKISYSEKDDFFHEDLEDLLKKFWGKGNIYSSKSFLNNYDKLDKIEDSIEFKIGAKSENLESKIQVNGAEIKTSVRTSGGSGEVYILNNHFYLIKLKFLNARFKINSTINIVQDISKLGRKIFITGLLTLIPVFILIYSVGDKNVNLIVILSHYLNIPQIPLFIAIISISFATIWFSYSKFLRKNKINLENPEFEKKFDVYSEDQVESRKILAPSFMYRILDFANKINKNRVYEFFFLGDEIYIKYDLLKSGKSSFMEIDFSKGQEYVLKSFLEFYLEIKNIIEMAKDLNVFYFDKGSFSKEILRNK